jgi:hypothetical protein
VKGGSACYRIYPCSWDDFYCNTPQIITLFFRYSSSILILKKVEYTYIMQVWQASALLTR